MSTNTNVLGHICPNAELVPLWEFHPRGTDVHRRWNRVTLGGQYLVYVICTFKVMKSTNDCY